MLKAAQGLLLLALLWCYTVLLADAQVVVSSLRVENSNNLALVGSPTQPLFSWVLDSPSHEVVQTSYHILVSRSRTSGGVIWSSGVTASNRTQLIKYTGPQLTSHIRYIWSVNVSTSAGSGVATSDFEAGSPMSNREPTPGLEKRAEPPQGCPITFKSSSWIWTSDGNLTNAPVDTSTFQYVFNSPSGNTVQSALILLTVDNKFTLKVNGNLISNSGNNSWENASCFGITMLNTAQTVFTIIGTNEGDHSNPAGVLAAIQLTLDNGTTYLIHSDGLWDSTKSAADGPSPSKVTWAKARVLARFGLGPWGDMVKLPNSTSLFQIPISVPHMAKPPNAAPSIPSPPTASSQNTPLPIITSPSIIISPPATLSTPQSTLNTNGAGANQHVGAIVGGVLGSIIFILLVLAVYLWWRQRPRTNNTLPTHHLPHPFDMGYGDRRSFQTCMSLDVASSAPSIKYLPSISPSMSISAVAERNRRNRGAIQRAGSVADLKTKVRLERLEELVLALDREISSGGGDNVKIARLRERVAEVIE